MMAAAVITPERLLEESVDRAVDSVLRSLASDASHIPAGVDAAPVAPDVISDVVSDVISTDDNPASEIISHLCGHVAHALRGLGVAPHGPVSYGQPANDSAVPPEGSRLDIWR